MHTDKDRTNMAANSTNANLSAKAEEKRLRRSRRLAPKDDTNAPPEQFLELSPSREDPAKAAKRERRRVRKFQKKQALQNK
jgi:hypothetical protein